MQIGRTLSLIAADHLEHLLDLGEAFEYGALTGLATVDEVLDVFGKRRIGGEHGDGLQNRRRLLGTLIAVGGLFGLMVQRRTSAGSSIGGAIRMTLPTATPRPMPTPLIIMRDSLS